MIDFDKLCHLIENGIFNNEDRELLAQTLYYCCCGVDSTPILTYGAEFPLYVYCDSLGPLSSCKRLDEALSVLYNRIEKKNFFVIKKHRFNLPNRLGEKESELSLWETPDFKMFYLFYVHGDAAETYKKLYGDKDKGGHDNYILPACLCNYMFEFDNYFSEVFMANIGKRVRLLLGHPYSDKYKRITDFDSCSSFEGKIELFQRMYWYPF